jgi:hypothetical protein
MPDYESPQDTKIQGQVTPVAIAEWSRLRAWHGDTVTIAVRTSQVPDGSAVTVKILTKDGNTEVDTVSGLSISGSKVDHDYTIQWKDKTVSADKNAYVLKASIDDPKVDSALSPPLMVDLEPPVLSF